jgi:3-(3-hydroxy-phenyl)propionate hydroxylase
VSSRLTEPPAENARAHTKGEVVNSADVGADRVIVVGGGPVGYTTALLLARHRIPFVLLEAGHRVADEPRAGTIHPPTLELYASVDAIDRFLERGYRVNNYQYYDRTQGLIADFDLGVLADLTPYPFRLMLEQHKVCFIMQELLAEYDDIDIRLDHEVVGVSQDAHGVIVTARTDDREEAIRGSYVIGCDGGRSQVRKSMDVEFAGFTYPERFLILSTPYDFGQHGFAFTNYIADPQEWFALFKVPGADGSGLWRVVSPVDPSLPEDEIFADDAVQARMQRFRAKGGEYDVVHRNIYNVHQRVASSYRDGRVLLAGDAAHINNPLGGMGMNFGIHDAFNLVDKLGQVLEGGDDGLLDLYDRQRRTVAQEYLQRQTIENKNNIGQQDPREREKFYDGLRATVADRELLRTYLRRVTMMEGFARAASIT